MHRALIANQLLLLTSPPERAETMAGDLAEEARARGALWFAAALCGVCLAMFFQAFGTGRVRTVRVLVAGLAVWFAVYVAARVAGAVLGLHPLMIDTHDFAALSPATLLYLGTVLFFTSFLTGVLLGCGASSRQRMSPVMPLAVFWVSTALVGFCADVAAGASTGHCMLVYFGGVPLLYVAPLLLGGVLARPAHGRFRLGVSR